ncbi:phosphoribosyltransferase family protein [Arthrobacter sp. ISL-30]|uniref:phosphoribosyltransferase family protein n=1 Tax=Arthrobacter sp. ISL-30 TaxID=2819109 RepID=UPI001BE7631B|nr:dienelactone hydrolase family protein [Arthrobacter sp. ISL-30]
MAIFEDRPDAGRQLGLRLAYLRGQDSVVLGLPRGGVPVAFQVAAALDAPLDVIVVRKLGVPLQPELAMGAIGEEGAYVLDEAVLSAAKVKQEELRAVERRERAVLDERVARLRAGRRRIDLKGRIAIIVDDGIATGSTARVACTIARKLGAARVILAVPVASAEVIASLAEADDVMCLATPRKLVAIGYHYHDFSPVPDDDVLRLLNTAAKRLNEASSAVPDPGLEEAEPGLEEAEPGLDEDVQIPFEEVLLEGRLYLPRPAAGIVVFAHGSGSGRHSPRNQFVAAVLQEAGLGTLLLDLLSPREELNRANVFNVELLARRLRAATDWLAGRPAVASSGVGYFGASTGAGAALWAAAEQGDHIGAVVSRGGRPDLAEEKLALVRAPTLLIVGSADHRVLELNRQAKAFLKCHNRLELVEGATHLFEEPGTLEEVSILARDWFVRYLSSEISGASRGLG